MHRHLQIKLEYLAWWLLNLYPERAPQGQKGFTCMRPPTLMATGWYTWAVTALPKSLRVIWKSRQTISLLVFPIFWLVLKVSFLLFFTKSGILGGILATFGSQDKPFPFFVVPNILTGARSKFLSFSIFDDFLPVFYKIWYFWFLHHFGYLAQSQSTRNLPYINY